MKNLSRRLFTKQGLAGTLSFMGILSIFPSHSTAAARSSNRLNPLIDALKSFNNPVCEIATTKLLSLPDDGSYYDLHLRNANLNLDEITLIAAAVQAVHNKGGPVLRSFSMSYNPKLGNEGVVVLAKTLPSTLTEIGLVRCGIGDQSTEALIAWAAQAPKLHWLCVEENAFSDKAKDKLLQLGKARAGLLVVV